MQERQGKTVKKIVIILLLLLGLFGLCGCSKTVKYNEELATVKFSLPGLNWGYEEVDLIDSEGSAILVTDSYGDRVLRICLKEYNGDDSYKITSSEYFKTSGCFDVVKLGGKKLYQFEVKKNGSKFIYFIPDDECYVEIQGVKKEAPSMAAIKEDDLETIIKSIKIK